VKCRFSIGFVVFALVGSAFSVFAGEAPERLTPDSERIQGLIRAVLERPDAVLEAEERVRVPAREASPQVRYSIRGYQGWRLPDGAVVEYVGLEDREARKRRTREMISETGERPEIADAYRGHFLALRRSASGETPKTVLRQPYPGEVFGEIIRIDPPVWREKDGWVAAVVHSSLVFEPTLSRKMQVESVFALKELGLAAQRVVEELRYHHETRETEQYRNGELVGAQTFDSERRDFVASAVVVDEKGKPAKGVKVMVQWKKRIKLSITEGKSKYYEEFHETDANGRFEQKISRGTSYCEVDLYKKGYLPMDYTFLPGEPEKTIRLIPVPAFRAGAEDFKHYIHGSPVGTRRYPIGSLPENRGVGLRFEEGPKYGAQWTVKRDEADVWFEVDEMDLERKVRDQLTYAHETGVASWALKDVYWFLTMRGQRGLEIAPVRELGGDGLPQWLTHAEAPENGYESEFFGVAPLARGQRSRDDQVAKPALPSSFYFRKDGRYGRIDGLEFRFGANLVGEGKYISKRGWQGERIFLWEVEANLVMQARPLGHRMLVPREDVEEAPSWAKGR